MLIYNSSRRYIARYEVTHWDIKRRDTRTSEFPKVTELPADKEEHQSVPRRADEADETVSDGYHGVRERGWGVEGEPVVVDPLQEVARHTRIQQTYHKRFFGTRSQRFIEQRTADVHRHTCYTFVRNMQRDTWMTAEMRINTSQNRRIYVSRERRDHG
jgi:hypothetical protein